MQNSSRQPNDANAIEERVTIERPVETVFAFYRDFRNLPSFLGDVMEVEPIAPNTSRWTIQGPLGIRARWTVRVIEERTNALIRYETVTQSRLRTEWDVYFSPGANAGETEVREILRIPGGRLGRGALALIGKFPAEEVHSNLNRLKQALESGVVTDTSYAVHGKFPRRLDQRDSGSSSVQ